MRNVLIFCAIFSCFTAFGAEPFVKKADIPYVPDGGERQQLDLYLPIGYEKAEKPFPVICIIHGGGWGAGGKEHATGWAHRYVPQGYAVAGITYRFQPKDPMPAQVVDCKTAVRWLRAHAKEYNLDSDRFGAWGHSAGGHLTAFLGAGDAKEFDLGENLDQSSAIQAAVDYCGPADFIGWLEENPNKKSMCKGLFGGNADEKKELIRNMSPVSHVSKDSCPMLIVHAVDDELVPVSQSRELYKSLQKVGVESELIELAAGDGGHGSKSFNTPATMEKVTKFYEKHLK